MKQLITREVRLKQCFRFGLLSAAITILPTLVESYMFNTSVSSLLTLYIKNCFTIFSLLILVLGYRKIQFKHRAKITIIFPSLVGKLNLTLIIITIIGILVTIVIDAISLDQSRKNVFVSNVTIVLTHNYLDSTQKNSNKTVFLQRNKTNIDAYYMGRKLLISDNDEQTFRKILLKEKFESQIYNKKRSCFIKNTLFQSNYKNVKQAYWRPMRYTAPFNEEFIFRFFLYSLFTGVCLYIIKNKAAIKKQKCMFIIFKGSSG